jgi:phytoene synthase
MDSGRNARQEPREPDADIVAGRVRGQDLDVWLAGLLAQGACRERHLAVWGVVLDVLDIPWKVSEPTLGLIRLQWWLDELRAPAPVAHPLNRLLANARQAAPHVLSYLPAWVEAAQWLLRSPLDEQAAAQWLESCRALPLALCPRDGATEREAQVRAALAAALGDAWGAAMLLRRAGHRRRSGLWLLKDRGTALWLLERGQRALKEARARQRNQVLWKDREELVPFLPFGLAALWLQAAERAIGQDRAGGQARAGELAGAVPVLSAPSQARRQAWLLWRWLRGRAV